MWNVSTCPHLKWSSQRKNKHEMDQKKKKHIKPKIEAFPWWSETNKGNLEGWVNMYVHTPLTQPTGWQRHNTHTFKVADSAHIDKRDQTCVDERVCGVFQRATPLRVVVRSLESVEEAVDAWNQLLSLAGQRFLWSNVCLLLHLPSYKALRLLTGLQYQFLHLAVQLLDLSHLSEKQSLTKFSNGNYHAILSGTQQLLIMIICFKLHSWSLKTSL